MQPQKNFSISVSRLVLTLGLSTAANIIAASLTWAQIPINSALSSSKPIAESDVANQPSPDVDSGDILHNSPLLVQHLSKEAASQALSDELHPSQSETHTDSEAPALDSQLLAQNLSEEAASQDPSEVLQLSQTETHADSGAASPSSPFPAQNLSEEAVTQDPSEALQRLQAAADSADSEEAVSTQAYDLLPGAYDFSPLRDEALSPDRQGWQLSQEAVPISELAQNPADDAGEAPATETDEPDDEDFNIPIDEDDDDGFSYGFGSVIPEPTALEGATRDLPVAAQSTQTSLIGFVGNVQQRLADNQFILLEFVADPQILAADLSYTIDPDFVPGAFSVNFFNKRSLNPSLDEGDTEVDLPNGDDPRVHRLGGGFEYSQAVTPAFDVAAGINYQLISVRDALFSDDLETVDELGNALTVSDDGQDSLLTLSFNGLFDKVSGQDFALQGTRVKFGIDQSIPVGDASIFFNRIVANATQFIPLRLFTGEPGTVVLNVQGGGTIGDVPPYETLSLGGSRTVRGFERGEVGSGSSFIQATAEYRFPLFSLTAFDVPLGIGGVVFVDYGSDLGTADLVIGDPAEARDKPGDGLGYGFGIHSTSPFGLLRLEFGFNDDGGSQVHFAIGDRF